MSDLSRPTSRWSTSMSVTTKSTNYTNQTIPLSSIRKKLFRNAANNQTYAQRLAKSKRDIEELFKLYYSNDIKFDTIHRQIVLGTRIVSARTAPVPSNDLTSSSANMFNSKHCVSREQMDNTELVGNEPKITTNTKLAPVKFVKPLKMENQLEVDSPVLINNPPLTVTPVIQNPTTISPKKLEDELCESTLVKSVTFFEPISNENANTDSNKLNNSPRSKSSLLTTSQTPAPVSSSTLLAMDSTNRKDTSVVSHTTFSTFNSIQPQSPKISPVVVTGSAVIVRPRSPGKLLRNRNRPKSTVTTTTATITTTSSLPQSAKQARSPSVTSPLSMHLDESEFSTFTAPQRIVSIPSKCSRYVLVTFPEAPLRYNAPSYVERLLLPERFPTLFQNIIHSYDHHYHHHHRDGK